MVKNKISLITAIFININIMIGAGIFMNPAPLTKFTGSFSFLGYIFAAIFLLPIVLVITNLAKSNPIAGGLYVYNKKTLGNFIGFLGGWSYFLGKATSAALLCNTFVIFFRNRILVLQKIPLLILDLFLILFLILINIFGVRIGGKIQYLFISAKFIPIVFVLFASLSIFNPDFFIFKSQDFKNLFFILPVSIYALLSFEIITSIGHMIKNPEKNLKRAILYSFLIVVGIATIFQFLIFAGLGKEVTLVNIPILLLGSKIFNSGSWLPAIINSFVFASILGGAFGSLTSNCWNLYALSKDNQMPFSKYFIKINKNNVPFFSLLFQGLIAFILLAISRTQVTLQNMTVFGMVTAYFLSSVSLFKILKKENLKKKLLPILAIASSFYMIFICIKNIIFYGISIPFILLFLLGIIYTLKKNFYLST
ncbi:amino acid permease [Candidatus Dependentiae bacterium]|nr:amino acid permease [Candidatus Dependentiae bacterium]